ncbi:MAG: nitroreductase family protein [Chloroflexi bacterium]|nr:nitroreductase family protein [Chloroflexota bacterium]
MNIDDFLRLVRSRRSIRHFKPDPVPDQYVEQILDAGRWAMSGANGQPWEYVVVKKPEIKEKLCEVYNIHSVHAYEFENSRAAELKHPARVAPPTKLAEFKEAPVIIVVCGDPRTVISSVVVASIYPDPHVFLMNLANSTMIMHLAAAALGLGSQWVSTTPVIEPKIRALLNIPDEYRIYVMIPIGYPAYKPAPPYRRHLDEIVHYDSYDRSRYRSDREILKYLADLRKKTTPAYKGLF